MTKIIKTDAYVQDKALGLQKINTPGNLANIGQLYTKVLGSVAELYYMDSAGSELRITDAGDLNIPPIDATKLVNGTAQATLTANSPEIIFTNPTPIAHLRLTYNSVLLGLNAGNVNTAVGTVAIGEEAGKANISSTGSLFLGYKAGLLATGANNTIMGYQAGDAIVAGTGNTIVGKGAAGSINAASNNNTIFGLEAMGNAVSQVTSATIIGAYAGSSNSVFGTTAVGYSAGSAHTSNAGSTYIGYMAGLSSTGGGNTIVGHQSGDAITSGAGHVCVGQDAGGAVSTSSGTTCVGFEAGKANTAAGTTAVGWKAGLTNAASTACAFFGYEAGTLSDTSGKTALGYHAGRGIGGNLGTFVGAYAGLVIGTGGYGLYDTAVGYEAAKALTTGSESVMLGYRSGFTQTTASQTVSIGADAGYTNNANGNVFIGYRAGYTVTTGVSSVYIGWKSGDGGVGAASCVAIGEEAGRQNTAIGTTTIGYRAGTTNTSSAGSTYIGYNSGALATGADNTIVGHSAGDAIVAGAFNAIFGKDAAGAINGASECNTVFGAEALGTAAAVVTNVTAFGYQAARANTASGTTAIGYQAGRGNTSGTANIYLGPSSGSSITTGSGNIIIGPIVGAAADARTFKVGYHATNEPILSGVMYDGAAGSGGTDSSLQVGVQQFTVYDPETSAGIEAFRVKNGKLSTYGEIAPDVVAGGLCLMASAAGAALSLKGLTVDHGCTSFMETDTWGRLRYGSATTGSVYFDTISVDTAAVNDLSPALIIGAVGRTVSGDYSVNSRSSVEINTALQDSVTPANAISWAAEACLFGIRNNKSTKFIVAGNGKVYADDTYNTYDIEDDIKLVQSFSNKAANPYYARLKDLGIITDGGMVCMQDINMLSIGAIGQLFNIIRALAIKLGISEDELYALAKQY